MVLGNHCEELDSSGAHSPEAHIVPDNRRHDSAEDLHGVQHFLVRKRRDAHLECHDSRRSPGIKNLALRTAHTGTSVRIVQLTEPAA